MADSEARLDNTIRRLLFVELEAMGIDPVSDDGLRVIEEFRPETEEDGDVDRLYTHEAIRAFIDEVTS